MTSPRAVLAGGSGFIGTRLAADLSARGYTVVQIGRHGPDARWARTRGSLLSSTVPT